MKSIADDIRESFPHKHEKLKEIVWLAELFDEHQRLIEILKGDALIALTELQSESEENEQFIKRSFVRTTFAAIEGIMNVLKQSILGCYKIGMIELAKKDFERLVETEESFESLLIKPKRIPLKDMMKFIYTTYSNNMKNREMIIDVNSPEWMAFCEGIKIRDRLTHPKTVNDLIVTQEELNALLVASKWFFELVMSLWELPFYPKFSSAWST